MISRRAALAASVALSLFATAALAQAPSGEAPSGKITVVTSFSKDVTDPIKKAFEKAVPGVTLEVQNRNTNAGVKYLEETKANNQVDLFWASAPDAFEVLKGKNLLTAYKPKATGIPDKIGSYPINDPAGFYSGFAASGYGIMWNERYAKANRLPEPKDWQDLAKPAYFDHVSIASPARSGTTHLTIETILQGNILAGTVSGSGDARVFAVDGGVRLPVPGDAEIPPGAKLVFRPQQAQIARPGASGGDRVPLPGTISHREFLGASVRYGVRIGATEVAVDQPFQSGEPLHEVGEPVELALASRGMLWLAA